MAGEEPLAEHALAGSGGEELLVICKPRTCFVLSPELAVGEPGGQPRHARGSGGARGGESVTCAVSFHQSQPSLNPQSGCRAAGARAVSPVAG